MHGAGGGQAPGSSHPNYKHGLRTKQMEAIRGLVSFLNQPKNDSCYLARHCPED
jgi:hypothetical protein